MSYAVDVTATAKQDKETRPRFGISDLQDMWSEHRKKRVIDEKGRIVCTYNGRDGEIKIRFPLLGARVAERLREELLSVYGEGLTMLLVGALQAGIIPGLPLASQSPGFSSGAMSTGVAVLASNQLGYARQSKERLFAHAERYVVQTGQWVKLLASSEADCVPGEEWHGSKDTDRRVIKRPGEGNDIETGYDSVFVAQLEITDLLLMRMYLENLAGFIGGALSSWWAMLLTKASGSQPPSTDSSSSSQPASGQPAQT